MGNSEVGHLNLGAGAIVKQDLARIDEAIADGSFFENAALRAACARRASPRGRLHAIGLVSDGGVHSGWEHIEAMIELAASEGVPDLVLHALTDGRDTLPKSGAGYLEGGGRALAPPRRPDRHGRRPLLGHGPRPPLGPHQERLRRDRPRAGAARGGPGRRGPASYERGVTDEFIEPTVIGDYDGIAADEPVDLHQLPARPRPPADHGPRRARTSTSSTAGAPPALEVTTMTEYRHGWPYPVAFPPQEPETTLAEVIAERGERQLHVAETEKYAHVTYFFNGGREEEWEGEERHLVDSPRDVPTYDHKPEMSAAAAAPPSSPSTGRADGYRFGIINFANPDMVGHTGVIPAAVAAVEEVTRPSARWSPPCTRAGAPASSPPTTATPSRCWSPTARPTPPTRPTRCR